MNTGFRRRFNSLVGFDFLIEQFRHVSVNELDPNPLSLGEIVDVLKSYASP